MFNITFFIYDYFLDESKLFKKENARVRQKESRSKLSEEERVSVRKRNRLSKADKKSDLSPEEIERLKKYHREIVANIRKENVSSVEHFERTINMRNLQKKVLSASDFKL